jgi:predicted nucleic acid-binding protein
VVALLDSSVIAGFLDRDDPLHPAADRRLRELAGHERLVVSVITYAEMLTGAGVGHHDLGVVAGFFVSLIDEIIEVDPAIAERAADLRTEHRALRMPDALILATAVAAGVDLIITGDRRWRTVLPGGPPVELLEVAVA